MSIKKGKFSVTLYGTERFYNAYEIELQGLTILSIIDAGNRFANAQVKFGVTHDDLTEMFTDYENANPNVTWIEPLQPAE